jgi:hypothetical protein
MRCALAGASLGDETVAVQIVERRYRLDEP